VSASLSVSLSVCHAAQLGFTVRGSFGVAFAESLWPIIPLRTSPCWRMLTRDVIIPWWVFACCWVCSKTCVTNMCNGNNNVGLRLVLNSYPYLYYWTTSIICYVQLYNRYFFYFILFIIDSCISTHRKKWKCKCYCNVQQYFLLSSYRHPLRRVCQKRYQWYFVCNIDIFKYIDVIFGRQHFEETVNLTSVIISHFT